MVLKTKGRKYDATVTFSYVRAGGSTFEKHENYNGSLLQFHRVERRQMGVYLCIASNDVPPAVSKRVMLAVNCKFPFLSSL